MPRNPNLGTSTLRNRNRVTNKTRLKVIQGSIDADPLVVDEDEEKARIISTAGVDAEDANEHHLQAVLSAASRHQSVGRSTRGEKAVAPAAYIPTPDSTGIVDNYDELYPPQRWEDPGAYIRSSETVDEAVSNALIDAFTYYMDERDKEWLDRNNEEARGEGTSAQGALSASGTTTRSGLSQRSAKAKGKEPESTQPFSITEDEFELVMGIFEKVTHDRTEFLHHGLESGMAFPPFTDYQEAFSSPLPPSMFATYTVPTWIPQPAQLQRLAKVIYPYWRDRRVERKGHRIIPILNYDESDVFNESYICFRRREIKAVRKTRASQATSSDKLLRLQNELAQGLELAKTLLSRENIKREYTQQTLQVWDKRFEFAELKRKFPSLGTKEDEELLHDKERVAKKPKIEPSRITGLKIRTRESGDPGSPAVAAEASIRPKERLSLINAAMERDLASQKERDHGYEDVVENPYQRPTFSFPRRHWKAIFPSRSSTSSPNVADEEPERVRYVRHRLTRLGNTTIDRRDAFMRRLGIRADDSTFTRRRQGFAQRMDVIVSEEDEEISARLRERWRFDQDDEPTVVPEGADEQDRILIDDYDPKYLRHMMTLLSDQDHQSLTTDNTIVVTVDGRQHSVSPYRLGVQPQYTIRRDQNGVQRVYPGGMPLATTRAAPVGIPMPNGVPISMQAHVKAMQPPSAIPQMRISSNGGMRPPVIGNIASPSTPVAAQQSSPPRATASSNGVNGNHAGTPTPDGDSVRLIAAPNGIAAASINGTQHQSTDVQMSPTAEPPQSNQTGSPARPKVEPQHVPVSVSLSSYHIPMNGYPNGAVMQMPRPPNGLTMQQMQSLKMAFVQNAEGRPAQVPYPGHPMPNGTHFNMQLAGGANLIKLPQGRQWPGVASPHQQPAQLNEGSPSPHVTPGNLPTRTPSANGTRTANRTGSISVPQQVGQLLPNQYAMSPHMQHNSSSPLPSSIPLPSHQSPPRPPPTPTMKMASPSLQHQQVVQSSQGGY